MRSSRASRKWRGNGEEEGGEGSEALLDREGMLLLLLEVVESEALQDLTAQVRKFTVRSFMVRFDDVLGW